MGLVSIYLLTVFAVILVQAEINFEIEGNHYMISTPIKKNWHQALRHCYLNGMYLVDMNTRDEFTKIVKYMREHPDDIPLINYWTAGTATGSEGEFYWATTGKTISYDGFPKGQPDNAGGMEWCVEMSELFKFEFNDRDCRGINAFICRDTRYFNLQSHLSEPPTLK